MNARTLMFLFPIFCRFTKRSYVNSRKHICTNTGLYQLVCKYGSLMVDCKMSSTLFCEDLIPFIVLE